MSTLEAGSTVLAVDHAHFGAPNLNQPRKLKFGETARGESPQLGQSNMTATMTTEHDRLYDQHTLSLATAPPEAPAEHVTGRAP